MLVHIQDRLLLLQLFFSVTTTRLYRISDRRSIVESGTSCPHGYNWKEQEETGFCFWETSYETKKLSFEDSRNYCKSYGGDLASFHSLSDERLALSFQYGSLSHSYWIGLVYDAKNDSYVWLDGSPLDYVNWGNDQPNDRMGRFRCVQMDATLTHWVSAYCGQLSWFVCKAPKQVDPPLPVTPTREPMVYCSDDVYYFEGSCYSVHSSSATWFPAQILCNSNGANLVSIQSEKETDFLIRMLDMRKDLLVNTVWIGMSPSGEDNQFQWADGTPLNFVNWGATRDATFRFGQCTAMSIHNGVWSVPSCSLPRPFICKKSNSSDSSVASSTLAPITGNCEQGWYTFGNRCYRPFTQKLSWEEARTKCLDHKAWLASIENVSAQAFLTLLLQDLKSDMWIGLRQKNSIEFVWEDSYPIFYTNWAIGELATNRGESCVHLSYNKTSSSGQWKASSCQLKLPYICKKRKSKDIETEWIPRAHKCLYPQGWLKQGMSCYMRFADVETYEYATRTCALHNARLVSITDISVEAVVKYITMGVNESHWIGLERTEGKKFQWINGWPLSMSRWSSDEPTYRNDCLTVDSKASWKGLHCDQKLPFICQVSAIGRPPEKKIFGGGHCPSIEWVDLGDENCYLIETAEKATWYNAELHCFSKGSHLVSIHSTQQMEKLRNNLKTSSQPFYIGLSRNRNFGLQWSDSTPFDFVNWDQGEPNGRPNCGDMMPGTFSWRVTVCDLRKAFVCSIRKENLSIVSEDSQMLIGGNSGSGISTVGAALLAVVVLVVIVGLVAAAIWFYRPNFITRFRLRSSRRVLSFENALFNANPSTEIENRRTSTLYVSDDNAKWSECT